MIVDYNKFVSGAPLPQSDLLWVLEQMPLDAFLSLLQLIYVLIFQGDGCLW
jgi:fermentation-respiration switch protein FrsA (DUF1100 family)